jgi:hypothetical protein
MRFKWSILVLTQTSRAKFLRRLLDVLDPQVEKFKNQVHVDVRMFDSSLSLGENREVMRQDSMGDYQNSIDDDDLVPQDYVATILPLLDGIDYIGFPIKIFMDSVLERTAIHSLQYPGWTTKNGIHYRDISHLNPMRRDLSLLCPMEGGVAEDFRWAYAMRQTGMVRHEHFIDRPMYDYLFRRNKNAPPAPVRTEKDVRIEELDLCEKTLSWINHVRDYVKNRRRVLEVESPNLECKPKDIMLDEVNLLERQNFDVYPVQVYISGRRKEIAGL